MNYDINDTNEGGFYAPWGNRKKGRERMKSMGMKAIQRNTEQKNKEKHNAQQLRNRWLQLNGMQLKKIKTPWNKFVDQQKRKMGWNPKDPNRTPYKDFISKVSKLYKKQKDSIKKPKKKVTKKKPKKEVNSLSSFMRHMSESALRHRIGPEEATKRIKEYKSITTKDDNLYKQYAENKEHREKLNKQVEDKQLKQKIINSSHTYNEANSELVYRGLEPITLYEYKKLAPKQYIEHKSTVKPKKPVKKPEETEGDRIKRELKKYREQHLKDLEKFKKCM